MPDRQGDAAREDEGALRSIQDVARELSVTPRALRFYEDKGLVEPLRVGTTRVYTRRAFGRLQLILRGKRLGFSLREIAEFLALYDSDPTQREQLLLLLEAVRVRMADLEAQRSALDETMDELHSIEEQTLNQLRSIQ